MNIDQNIKHVKQLIAEAAMVSNRSIDSVLLLAVSKTQPVASIAHAFELGLRDFGESYYQEAIFKINALKKLPICWHFIGPVQSNKTKGIASHFQWVHGINRMIIARLLNEYRPVDMPPLQVCLHVNLIPEETKSGILPEEAKALAQAVSQLPNLKLRGLMTIPPPQKTEAEQYRVLIQLKELMDSINADTQLNMDTLSMGMSNDLIPAIKAGASIVRIGRAIFGERSVIST